MLKKRRKRAVADIAMSKRIRYGNAIKHSSPMMRYLLTKLNNMELRHKYMIFLLLGMMLGVTAATYLSWIADKDAALLYVGDCVDIRADADGYHGTPKQVWDLYAQQCADRYNNR